MAQFISGTSRYINKARLARDSQLSRTTIYHAFDPNRGVSRESIEKISAALYPKVER